MSPEVLGKATCAGCGAEIGDLIAIKGRLALYRSGLTVYVGFFRCGLCGGVYHFDSNKINRDKIRSNGSDRIARSV